MNKYVNTETTFHSMKLLQLGANVEIISGKMVYVEFKLKNDIHVSYVYHINKNDKYFLDRIKPYPLPIKEVEQANDVINLIKIDLEQFKNAVNSNNIRAFIDTNKELHQTMKSLEDLFLYYNVDETYIDEINEQIKSVKESIKAQAKVSQRVYNRKDPDNL